MLTIVHTFICYLSLNNIVKLPIGEEIQFLNLHTQLTKCNSIYGVSVYTNKCSY